MTCARLYPWKNLEFLIRLVPDLPSDVTLVIVGDGPEREQLEREAVAAGVPERVYFAGSVSQATVQQYLQAADVFALHTRYEGLSHVMLEAMHAGTPIVASDVGGERRGDRVRSQWPLGAAGRPGDDARYTAPPAR